MKNSILLIAGLKTKRIHRYVYILDDPIKDVEKKYKFLMSSHLKRFKKMFSVPLEESTGQKAFHSGQSFVQYYPNEILENQLYLGDANHATSKYVMRNMRIKRVVNVTDTIPNKFEQENIRYLAISVDDRENVDIINEFEEFYKFI